MGKEIVFILNDAEVRTALPAGTALLDVIRRDQRLTGTREGCREGDCGACTVLLGRLVAGRVSYRAVVSCLLPLAEVAGCHVVTIEGLNQRELTPVQQAIVSEGATQCGFCTPGIVVSLTGFLLNSRELTAEEAVRAIEGNICRCTGYVSLRRAIERLLREVGPRLQGAPDRQAALIELHVLPEYFGAGAGRLKGLPRAGKKTTPVAAKGAVVVAGGTDLYVQHGGQLPEKELLLLSRRQGYAGVWPGVDRLFIGAATTVAELIDSPLLAAALPELAGHLRSVAAAQVRERATVGGNIVNASPIGDLSVILLALAARVGLRGNKGNRAMDLSDFFLGYKKLNLRPGELLAWVSIPVCRDGRVFHFEKVARRRSQDIAAVNSAIGLEMAGKRIVAARVAAGGVAPVPLCLNAASAFLAGKTVSATLVRRLAAIAEKEIAPISDVRGSAAYKRSLLRRLLAAHFLTLFPDAFAPGELP